MKISVETKFNIGDIVYVADNYDDYIANSEPHIVQDVLINVSRRGTHILYEVNRKGFTFTITEAWVFATYAECTKWCEEHN